ncbi:MAG: putative toxin-antitoxin system toxin component, PIN family [Bryobacterales bacterium]|nr:putative toxin-antitoxin system toxin component, PIN family [Bryobacterales bacterium]
MRVVLDTNILISACWTPAGNEAQVIALAPRCTFCVSPALAAEYRDVATRKKFAKHRDCLNALIGSLLAAAATVDAPPICRACSDPDDNLLLDTALAAGAQFVVTGNLRHFPAEWRGIEVLNARQFLGRL